MNKQLKTIGARLIVWTNFLFCTTLALQAHAQVVTPTLSVEAISHSTHGSVEVVKIDFSQPLSTVPAGISIQSPARISFDIPGATYRPGRGIMQINQGNVQSVDIRQIDGRAHSVRQINERVHFVLNLKAATSSYQARLQGNSLLVSVKPVPGAAIANIWPEARSGTRNTDLQPIRDIDFRRLLHFAGQVPVEFSSDQVGIDIKRQDQSLVIEFSKSSLPESLRRRLDVSDFETPVQMVSTVQAGDHVRMVIDSKGEWHYRAYQINNQFALEIRSQKKDESLKSAQGLDFTGETLSLNVQNADVLALLQAIADFGNMNVVLPVPIKKNMSLRLKEVPWDQALDIILRANDLVKRERGNVLLITSWEVWKGDR